MPHMQSHEAARIFFSARPAFRAGKHCTNLANIKLRNLKRLSGRSSDIQRFIPRRELLSGCEGIVSVLAKGYKIAEGIKIALR